MKRIWMGVVLAAASVAVVAMPGGMRHGSGEQACPMAEGKAQGHEHAAQGEGCPAMQGGMQGGMHGGMRGGMGGGMGGGMHGHGPMHGRHAMMGPDGKGMAPCAPAAPAQPAK